VGELLINIEDFGAKRGETFNNAPAILAAFAEAETEGGGLVYAPPGVWGINAPVIVPAGVAFMGAGKEGGTIFSCMSAAAGVQFGLTSGGGTRRGLSGRFEVDGNDVATRPLVIALGANADYIDISVADSADIGLLIEGSQNIGIYGLEVQRCPKGLVVDRGAKNVTVTRGTINDCNTGITIRMNLAHPTGLPEPARIVVTDVLCETVVSGGIGFQVNAGQEIFFVRGALNVPTNGIAVKAERLDPAGVGAHLRQIVLDGAQLAGGGGGTGVQLLSEVAVTMIGGAITQGTGTTFDVRNADARIDVDHTVVLDNASVRRFSTNTGRTEAQIISHCGVWTMESLADVSATNDITFVQPAPLTLFTAEAESVWEVEADLMLDGSTTGQAQVGWEVPAGSTFSWSSLGTELVAGVLQLSRQAVTSAPSFKTRGAGTPTQLRLTGLLKVASASGNIVPEFKQAAADTAVPTRLLAGSTVRYRRIA